MSSRFEQAITAGVLAGAIALAGCAASNSESGNTPDGNGPVLESAIAYEEFGEPLDARDDTVVLTFLEPVQLVDAEAAAGAFTLAENVGDRQIVPTSTCTDCEVGFSTSYVAPFYACLSAPEGTENGEWEYQCAFASAYEGEISARTLPYISDHVPTVRLSSADNTKLILDYSEVTNGLDPDYSHGVLKLRLRYTDPESHPIQDLDGNTLEDIEFPDHDSEGNVDFEFLGLG